MSFSPQRARADNAVPVRGPGEQAQTGSVRAARERLRAVQASRTQALDEANQLSPRSPAKRPWETPTSPNSRQRTYEQDYHYQESPVEPSWPLPASRYNAPGTLVNAPPPIRKDRNSQSNLSPQFAETFYDGASDQMSPQNLQPPMPVFGAQRDSNYSSATTPSVPRGSSWASNSSGSIPDFPLPTSQYQSGRRSQAPHQQQQFSQKPPRRGQSSYYSQMSGPWGVSPIPEETFTRTNTNSLASSNVMPSQMKDFYLEETPSDDEKSEFDYSWEKSGEKGEYPSGAQPSPGLVRQASLGRMQKPALKTIKGENLRAPAAVPAVPLQVPASEQPRTSQAATILGGESLFLDPSLSSSEKDRPKSDISFLDPFNPGGPLGRLASLRSNEKGGIAERRGMAGARAGARRPPSLDVQAVREAEARASLTSLPDLIRRATRLAANLERGRTASRLGIDWMVADGQKPSRHRPSEGSSLGGMLANFPPPATIRGQTPSADGTAEELYKELNISRLRNGRRDRKPQRRQICGMSRRAFWAFFVVVLILVAAAVVLPVFLIILPNKDKNLGTSVTASAAVQACQKSMPCSNSGTSVVNLDNSCGCVCSNGFTGPQCNTESKAGCTTIQVAGKSASVGTQIPGLVQAAQNQYLIPLDNTALSSAFAADSMTCTTENALVTFPGASSAQRRSPNLVERYSEQSSQTTESASGSSTTAAAAAATATTNPAASASNAAAGTSTSSAASALATAASGSSGTSVPSSANATALVFAQIGILFVMQDSRDLSIAESAQERLAEYFQAVSKNSSYSGANNITLGSDYLIDLNDYIMTLRNGTRYGLGVNFNGTASTSK